MKNRNINRYYLFVLTVVIFALGACSSPQKLLESGNYDEAILLSTKKLTGKKKKKEEYVRSLEAAFEKATQRDMAQAERLKKDNQDQNWDRIVQIYRTIDRRQERIRPLLPLVDQHGIKANFRFVRVDGLLREAKENAADFHYQTAQTLLEDAKSGDKLAARRAYNELEKVEAYFPQYRDKEQLKRIAHTWGTSHILLSVKNQANTLLPYELEEELKHFNVRDLQNHWQVFYTESPQEIKLDYKVVLSLDAIDIGPSLVREREYEESREIEDGYDYVLDENGNVTKDTLGNDIKIPRYRLVQAMVLETHQQKIARVIANYEVYDLHDQRMIETRPLQAEAIFENYAATFRGDKRALSRQARSRIGNRPLPFPSDGDLLFDAVSQLKPIVKERISNTRKII